VDLDVFSGGSGDVVHLAARRLEVEQAGHLDVLDSFIYIPGAVYLPPPPSAWVSCRVVSCNTADLTRFVTWYLRQIWLCLFFFLHGLLLAVLTAFLGWVTMLVCLISFYKRSWIAVGFLAPAFAWKTFVVFDVLVIWFVPPSLKLSNSSSNS
jgi:hypothetical protein